MSASTGTLNETENSPIKSVHRKSISLDHTNGERFERKNYKLIDAVDRNGRLIPYVTIYVPIEGKEMHEHINDNNYYKHLGRMKYSTDPKRTVLKFKTIYKLLI